MFAPKIAETIEEKQYTQQGEGSFQPKSRVRRQYNPDYTNIVELFAAIRKHKTGNPLKDKISKIHMLLAQIQNINEVDLTDNGNTPLHVAISKGHQDVVELLLQKQSIDVNIKNNKGDTPLHIAASKDNQEFVRLLLSKQVKIDIKNNKGEIPLDISKQSSTSNGQEIANILEAIQQQPQQKSPRLDSGEMEVDVARQGNKKPAIGNQLESSDVKKVRPSWTSNKKYTSGNLKKSLHGNDYQLKLLMLFAWEARTEVAFRLATEMAEAEKFDDLVFRYTNSKGHVSYRFLQAKHRQFLGEENKIKVSDLKSDKDDNDFSLQKYFISYLKDIRKQEFQDGVPQDFDFIICTNTDFDFEPSTTKKEYQITKDIKNTWKGYFSEKTDEDKILNSGFKRYQFSDNPTIRDSVISELKPIFKESLERNNLLSDDVEKIDEFLDKLVFAIEQPGETLEQKIKEKIGDAFNLINDITYNDFFKFMSDWMQHRIKDRGEKGEGRAYFLTHSNVKQFFNEAKQKIASLGLISSTLLYKAAIEKSKSKFKNDIQAVQKVGEFLNNQDNRDQIQGNKKQILIIYQKSALLSGIKVCQVLANHNTKVDRDIFSDFKSLSLLVGSAVDPIRAFNSEGKDHLIIEHNSILGEDAKKLLKNLYEVLIQKSDKRIILITPQEHKDHTKKVLDSLFNEKYIEFIEDENNNLNDLTPESQRILLKEGKVIFQGKEVSLGTLIDEESKNLIDAEVLSRLINNEKVEIGKAPDDLGDVKYYYIDRVFNRQVKVRGECLKAREIPDLFAISNIEQDELYELVNEGKKEQKVRKFVDNDSDNSKPVRFIVLDNENAEKNFKQLNDDYSSHNIHWLKKEGGEFIWQQSYGASLSNLRRYLDDQLKKGGDEFKWKLPYGVSLSNLLYDQIIINKKNIEVGEREFIKLISSDGGNKVVIISAEPGMGKSTVMTNLAKEIKKYTSSRWVIKVNFFNLVKMLYEVDLKLIKKDYAIKFLVNALNLKVNMLSENLFRHCLEEQGGVILLLDGFDEISPNYKEKAINLLKELKETQINRILVSTRGYMQDQLEDAFSTLSYTLKPFSLEDQKNFLRKFWQKKLCHNSIDEQKFQKYSDKLLELFSQSISDIEKEFTGVPLLIEMLAENHERGFKDFCDSKKNELPNHLSQEKFDLLTLYEDFIEKKHNRYHLDKLGKRKEIPGITKEVKKLKEQFMKDHKLFAMQRLFSEGQLKLLLTEEEREQVKELVKEIDSGEEKTGIVNKVIGDKPDFIHLSFAEYFAVELISDKLKSTYPKQPVLDFLVNTIFTGDYQNIRRFFDSKLASDHTLAKSSSKNGKTVVNLLLAQDSKGPLVVATRENLVNIIDFLLKTAEEDLGSLIKIINTLGEGGLPLCLAIENGHKEAVEILLKYVKAKNCNRLIEIIIPTDTQHGSPLFLAVSKGDDEIVDILLENIPSNDQIVKIICNANNEYGTNLVALAAEEETFSLSSLDEYIKCLNSDQQVQIFGDLSNLGFEHFEFIDYLDSVLNKDAFYKICRDNQEEIRGALAQERDDRSSPDQHPDWFLMQALMEESDENEMYNDYYHDSL